MSIHNLIDDGLQQSPGSVLPQPNNLLLAGLLAHEYLTRGTLCGTRFPQETRPAKMPMREKHPTSENANANGDKQRVYLEVACLLREEKLHLPGIVNPSQLALHMKIL